MMARTKYIVRCTLCFISALHHASALCGPASRRSILRDQVLLPLVGAVGAAACTALPTEVTAAEGSLPFMGTTSMLANPTARYAVEAKAPPPSSPPHYVSNGVLWKTGSGQALPATPSFLARIMQKEVLGSTPAVSSGIICISERHDDYEHHKVQLKVLMSIKKAFAERSQDASEQLSIGMEMFQRQHQIYLDRFIAKSDYTLANLKRDTNWDSTWGYDILHYLPILVFARKSGIRILGLHPSDELVEKVKRQGLSSLSPSVIDKVCTDDRDHAEDFRRLAMQRLALSDFGCQEAMDVAISRQYEVQCFREEYMAQTAAIQMSHQPDCWVAILAGERHILGRNGLPFRALRRLTNSRKNLFPDSSPSRGVFTIIPKTISFPMAARNAPGMDSADYVWFVQRDPSTEFREDKINLAPPARRTQQA